MTISGRFLVLLLSGLLSAATSCQRASYSFQPLPTAAAGPVSRPPHPAGAPFLAPPGEADAALVCLPGRPAPRVALRALRRQSFRILAAGLGARVIPSRGRGLAAHHRRAPAASPAHRQPTSVGDEYALLIWIALGLVLALIAGIVVLISAGGSSSAILLGLLLMLPAILVAAFIIF